MHTESHKLEFQNHDPQASVETRPSTTEADTSGAFHPTHDVNPALSKLGDDEIGEKQ